MRSSQLMRTPAVTCGPDRTIRDVATLMAERRVGSVLIVDQVGELVGIVTDRDVAIRGVAKGHSGEVRVERIMTRHVASVSPATDVADAAALMVKRSIRRVPVVDERGHAHGLLSLDDVIRHIGRQADELGDVVASQAGGHNAER